MSTVIKRGNDDPLQQSWETSWSPQSGSSTNIEFKGINLTKMSALALTYAQAGYTGRLRFERDVATLDLTAAFSSIPGGTTSPYTDITDKWEVSVDNEKPELFENETFLSIVTAKDSVTGFTGTNKKSIQIIAAIKESDSNPTIEELGSTEAQRKDPTKWKSLLSKLKYTFTKNEDGTDSADPLGFGINIIGSHPNLHDFATDYFEGRTSFLRGKYVVRHHTNAPSNYAANVADWNVERLYTISQLLSECQSTSLWILPMPGYLAYKILNYTVPTYLRGNYMWSALKTRSSAITAARGRVEIQTEYLIDGWPLHTYPVKT